MSTTLGGLWRMNSDKLEQKKKIVGSSKKRIYLKKAKI
jgi:hypothetical protein